MREKDRGVINIGTTSLVLIFAVLALVTFALLSYSSADAQWKLAQKLADRTTAYYEAEAKAAEQLQGLDASLASKNEVQKETMEAEESSAQDEETVSPGERSVEQSKTFSWKIPVGEKQQLEIRVQMEISKANAGWKLEQWQLTDSGTGLEQQSLELFGSGS